jgi:hypothetical protein
MASTSSRTSGTRPPGGGLDLPAADDAAGLAKYADSAVDAIGDLTDRVVVAQSLAGFGTQAG